MKKVLIVLFLAQAVAIGVALLAQRAQAAEVRFTPLCMNAALERL